jgi:hypothetical protein
VVEDIPYHSMKWKGYGWLFLYTKEGHWISRFVPQDGIHHIQNDRRNKIARVIWDGRAAYKGGLG